jgi:hypothetical protein
VTDTGGCTDSDTINVTVIIGIDESQVTDFHLSAYPNPTNGDFTLNFTGKEGGEVEIRIVNALGMAVYSEKIENFKGEYAKKISLENFAAGIYQAEVLKGTRRSAIKIMVE